MADNNQNMDLFMKLKDSCLIMVISSLSFKEAARTCVLSKLWGHIWRATRNLEFCESFFVDPNESEENKDFQIRVFAEFARRLIGNYTGLETEKLSLTFSRPGSFPTHMNAFISIALSRNVKGLALDFSNPSWRQDNLENHAAAFDLPKPVYWHKDLESLKLYSCRFLVDGFKNLSAIKELSLGWIELNVDSMKALLVHCPLLESLSLKKCWNNQHLDICGKKLRLHRLILDNCNFGGNDYINSLLFDVPNLRYFKYSGKVAQFEFDRVGRIIDEADLDFGLEPEFYEIGLLLYNLLHDLTAARVLTVCTYLLQVIPTGDEPLCMQCPLDTQHLILKTALHVNEFIGVKFMLESCNLLETLTIDLCPARVFPDYLKPYEFLPNEFWAKNLIVQKCVKSSLKVVQVKGFTAEPTQLHVLRYLIHFGRVMERMDLYISDGVDADGRNQALQRVQWLQSYRHPSSNVLVTVHN